MFLRMVSRPLMAKVKQTTGIKNASEARREVFIGLYTQILNEIKKLPDHITYRKIVEKRTNHKLKVCWEEQDVEYIPRLIDDVCPLPVKELIKEAHWELTNLPGWIADWNCNRDRPLTPLVLSKQTTASERRELLMEVYSQALNVVYKVPENNKLRMFAERSIKGKLKFCWEEHDWESIKRKLDYEDPIEKAREELNHWSLFFGPDAYPNRRYPHVPRTKEFWERFNAWRELASPKSLKKLY